MENQLDGRRARKLVVPRQERVGTRLVPAPWLKIQDTAADYVLRAGDRLGFNPVSRPRIRVDPAQKPEPAGASDAWAELRLVDGGRK
jgi:hypothetical protein